MTNVPLVEIPPQTTAVTKLFDSPPTAVSTKLWKGHAYPLGATWSGDGVNFALFSEHATGVELCLFDRLGEPETERVRFTERANYVWHGFLPEGPARPTLWLPRIRAVRPDRMDIASIPTKFCSILTPRRLLGAWIGPRKCLVIPSGTADADLSLDSRDNAARVPKSVVVDPHFLVGHGHAPASPAG